MHLHRTLPTLVLILILFVPSAFVAQTSPQQKQDPKTGMGGVSTGEARTYTSRRTVGIVEANAPIIFEDVTARTALAKFKNRSGSPDKNYIVETVSGGVAIFDYDGDGRPDIYLLNGSTVAGVQGKERPPRAALYRNLGNWQLGSEPFSGRRQICRIPRHVSFCGPPSTTRPETWLVAYTCGT